MQVHLQHPYYPYFTCARAKLCYKGQVGQLIGSQPAAQAPCSNQNFGFSTDLMQRRFHTCAEAPLPASSLPHLLQGKRCRFATIVIVSVHVQYLQSGMGRILLSSNGKHQPPDTEHMQLALNDQDTKLAIGESLASI